jgi:hypothetical protein
MDEQILASVVRAYKSKTFFPIKPFYCTCTHNILLFGLINRPLNLSLELLKRIPPRDV